MRHAVNRPALAALAAASIAAPSQAMETIVQPFEGVRYITRTQIVPRELSVHILEIDLGAPDICFRVTPANGPDVYSEATRQTTLDYLVEQGAQAAINGDLYSVYGDNAAMSSMNASDGHIYSWWSATGTRPSMNIGEDNVATVVVKDPDGNRITPLPRVPLFNALGGNEWIVKDGVNAASNTSLAPRTATAVTADNRLLMVVVDGRQSHSGGLSTVELADLLMSYGAVNAVNHDGGGSTTMVLADTTPRVVNSPSDGYLRKVGNNLALFAAPASQQVDTVVFSDFYAGDEGTFSFSPGYSGSTTGLDKNRSTAEAVTDPTATRGWSQRLTLRTDEDGAGEWFVRHISGADAAPAANVSRPATGFVGFWARTTDEGITAAIAVDDEGGNTADRSIMKTLIADGKWHLYEWNLEDDSVWEAWASGDGTIDGDTFTLDSIQLLGTGDATVYLDRISHNAIGSLGVVVPEPGAASLLIPALGWIISRRRVSGVRGH